jgi:hypothetical protein
MKLHLNHRCYDFHAEQQLPCEKTSCRLWDEQLAASQNCTAIQARRGPHTLQELADMKMVPVSEILGEGHVETKQGIRLRINDILDKCQSRSARSRPEWQSMKDMYDYEETD